MTTKATFLQLGAGATYHEIAERINFDELDKFVAMFIYSYINRRGKEIVKEELAIDSLSESITFLTRIIDVGTLQFLSENKLISFNKQHNEDLAMVVALGINISMASVLKEMGVNDNGSNVFFDIAVLYVLVERVFDFIKESLKDDGYIFSLVSVNLMGMVNG